MRLKLRFVVHVIPLACALILSPSHAQEDIIKYTIQPNDSLWLIATRYYDDARAFRAIYKYAKNKTQLDKDRKVKSPDKIDPGSTIELPHMLEDKDTGEWYQRRERTPMNEKLGRKIADHGAEGIRLSTASSIVDDDVLPKDLKFKAAPPRPANDYKPLSQAPKAKRESTPEWFRKPDAPVEQCAKSLCIRFEQLCYFECLSVAKRLLDGDRESICDGLGKKPRTATVVLPYEVDNATRDQCAELIK
jgi:hypothetical protein